MKLRKRDRKLAAVLGKVRELSREERGADWSDGEWTTLMAAAVSQKPETREKSERATSRTARWRPALAYGGAVIIMAAVIGLALKDRILKRAVAGPELTARVVAQKDALAAKAESEAEAPGAERSDRGSRDKNKEAGEPEVSVGTAQPSKPDAGRPAPSVIQARRAAPAAEPASMAPAGPATQDTLTVRMVSGSGLRIVWVLDRNFEWKGESK